MKKVFLTLLLIVFFTAPLLAQNFFKNAVLNVSDREIGKFISESLKAALKKNAINFCLTSVTFAKFYIDENGNVIDITFVENPNMPPAFRNILNDVLKSTNGHWVPASLNGKQVKSGLFILPLIYDLEAGCTVKKVPDGTSNAWVALLNSSSDQNYFNGTFLQPLSIFFSIN